MDIQSLSRKTITLQTSAEKKLECYKLLVAIMQAENTLRQMKVLFRSKTDAILKEAGEGYSLTEDFDCIKEGVEHNVANDCSGSN